MADKETDYRYNEKWHMDAAMRHINSTYFGHYSNEIQTAEYIMSRAQSLDYLHGNVFKYVDRFGKKHGYNPEDIYKAIHYLCMMLYFAEKKFSPPKVVDENGEITSVTVTAAATAAVGVPLVQIDPNIGRFSS